MCIERTVHFGERCATRMQAAATKESQIWDAIYKWEPFNTRKDHVWVKVKDLPTKVFCSDGSNGDMIVVALKRWDKDSPWRVTTVFLRNRNQPRIDPEIEYYGF